MKQRLQKIMNDPFVENLYETSSELETINEETSIIKFKMFSKDYYISFRIFSEDEAKSYNVRSDLVITKNTYVIDFDLISNFNNDTHFSKPEITKTPRKFIFNLHYLFDFASKKHFSTYGGDLYLATPYGDDVGLLYTYLLRRYLCYKNRSFSVSYHESDFAFGGEMPYYEIRKQQH